MNLVMDKSAISPTNKIDWQSRERQLLDAEEPEIANNDHRSFGEDMNTQRLSQTFPEMLNELAGGLPSLVEVQEVRVWLYQPQQPSIRSYLLITDLPENFRAGMEHPLDEAVTAWLWQHQRPLIISAECESRFPEFAQLLRDCGIKYFCAVPMMLANLRIGVLGLISTSRDALSRFDLDFERRKDVSSANVMGKNGASPHSSKHCESFRGDVVCLERDVSSDDNFEGIIGRSSAIRSLRTEINVVAPTDSTVLILGETGTGKELIARAIHNLSPRRERPFVKVNCAAIPAGLNESELFGHERGAFTGAVSRRIGRFEMAHGGTLFLDEIGDVPLELQPKLLRVLQEQEFERVGSTQTIRVNVRVVAATSRDLPGMVATREFRGDLYYRLNVFPLRVLPLRERSDDIALLVQHFVGIYAKRMGKCIKEVPANVMEVLLRYAWPGNVRELQNVIERAVILSPSKVLRPSLDELKHSVEMNGTVKASTDNNRTTLKDIEREHIIQALAATNWILGGPKGAGARLGLARTTLIAKMEKLGITRAQA